jgi:hypothetical protein
MHTLRKLAFAAGLLLAAGAQAASKHDYTYMPAPGVHEVKHFHGCWDNTDIEKRPKIKVTMANLKLSDVLVETRQPEEGKPSTEMVTFRLKNMDASFKVQFRSNDGGHCQQGVQSIAFQDKVLHNMNELNAHR